MLHALRTELAYFRPWLLGGLGMGAGVSILVSVIFWLAASDAPSHAVGGIRAMFLIMAPLIVGFIVQAYRSEEQRARLLLSGPLTPRQIAGVAVLLPSILFGIGLLAAGLLVAAVCTITGELELESLHMVGYVGGLLFMMSEMGLLAQEATAAHQQRRSGAAVAGWLGFSAAVLALSALSVAAFLLQGPMTWPSLHLGNLVVALVAMVATVVLYSGRTDFTR